MKPLQINLAANPFRNDLLLWLVFSLLGLGALGLTAYNTAAFMTAENRQQRLQDDLAGHRQAMQDMQTESERLRADLAKVDLDVLESQAEFVAGVLQERNFAWTKLFDALEATIPWNVKLVAIRPTFHEGKIRLTLNGVARSMEAFLNMQDLLQASPRFGDVAPGDWQQMEGNETVNFTVTLGYIPETPESIPAEEAVPETVVVEGPEPGEGGEGDLGEGVVDEEPQDSPVPAKAASPPTSANPKGGLAGGTATGSPPGGPAKGARPLAKKAEPGDGGLDPETAGARRRPIPPLASGSEAPLGTDPKATTNPVGATTAGDKPIPGDLQIEEGGRKKLKVNRFDPSKLPKPPENDPNKKDP